MPVTDLNELIKEKHLEINFYKEKKMLPGSAGSFPRVRICFLKYLLRVTLPVNQISLLCAGFVFAPPQLGVMQSTTALATLGDFSCHKRQPTDHFWSWEMLFWAHAPPMLTQIWPKEAPRLFTDPPRCRESGSPARLGGDGGTTQLV